MNLFGALRDCKPLRHERDQMLRQAVSTYFVECLRTEVTRHRSQGVRAFGVACASLAGGFMRTGVWTLPSSARLRSHGPPFLTATRLWPAVVSWRAVRPVTGSAFRTSHCCKDWGDHPGRRSCGCCPARAAWEPHGRQGWTTACAELRAAHRCTTEMPGKATQGPLVLLE